MSKKNLPAVKAVDAPAFSVAEVLGLPAQATVDELFDAAAQADNASTLWRVRFGACLNRIQVELISTPNVRSFKNELDARGISEQRAFEAMKLASYVESLPEADARRMLKLQVTKLIELSKADPEVIADLLEDGSIDGDQPLSVRELRERLHDAERRAANAEAEKEQLSLQAETAAAYQSDLDKKSGFPAWLRQLRVGLVAECGGIDERLDAISGLLNEGFKPQAGDNQHDAELRLAGACTAVHMLNAIYARLNVMLDDLAGSLPEEALTGVNPLARLSDAEIAQASAARERLVDEAGYQRRLREHQQASEKPRGRGRPPKAPAAPGKARKKG